MKRELKKIDATKRELLVEVFSENFRKKFEEVYKKVSPDLKVQGFRPGKAPRDVIEKHFGQALRQQTIEEIIPETINKIIEEDKLELLDTPQISDIKWVNDTFSFKANFEVKPEISIDKYKGIKIKSEKIEVTDTEVDNFLNKLKEEKKLDSIDDNLPHMLGYSDLASLKEVIKFELWTQKDNQRKANIEGAIIKEISENAKFVLPESLVERRLKELTAQAKARLAMQGFSQEDVDKKEDEFKKRLKEQAETDVRVYLILEEIAHRQNITSGERMALKVMEFLYKEANWV